MGWYMYVQEVQRKVHECFVDLEKAVDKPPMGQINTRFWICSGDMKYAANEKRSVLREKAAIQTDCEASQ